MALVGRWWDLHTEVPRVRGLMDGVGCAGPMFVFYNTVLRAGGARVDWDSAAGEYPCERGGEVTRRFVSTIHCISSGVLKLGRLQPAATVYLGLGRIVAFHHRSSTSYHITYSASLFLKRQCDRTLGLPRRMRLQDAAAAAAPRRVRLLLRRGAGSAALSRCTTTRPPHTRLTHICGTSLSLRRRCG